MKEQDKNKINRRHFLKMMGVGAAAGTTLLYGCHSDKKQSSKSSAQLPVPTDKMTYRINPSTGDRVSLLGYGCMRWPTMPSPDGKGEIIDQEQVNRLVDYAIAHGVNFFDTSPVYVQGLSEKATGIALKRHPRNKYFISTKLSNFQNYSRENSIAMYKQSFKDLQTDYIDYYLLHAVGGGGISALKERYFDNGLLDFLLNERKAGRIRNLGFSFHGEVEVYDYLLASDIKWDFVLIQLNYVDWKHASGFNVNADYLYGELVKKGIRALVMEPLLGGRLTKLSDSLVARLKERRPEASVASWAFRFSGSPENVLSVLSGMTYMEHLQDNIRTYSPLEPLTDEEKDFLEETAQILLKYPTIPCTDCKYCMPCPYGIDIPTIFMHYNKCVNEGNVPKSQQDPIYREARTAFLVGYDRTVPRLRQASHCIGCEICKPHCPQSIEIPEELHRIDALWSSSSKTPYKVPLVELVRGKHPIIDIFLRFYALLHLIGQSRKEIDGGDTLHLINRVHISIKRMIARCVFINKTDRLRMVAQRQHHLKKRFGNYHFMLANGFMRAIIQNRSAHNVHSPALLCPLPARLFQLLPVAPVQVVVLRTNVGHVKTLDHSQARPFIIACGTHVPAVIA